MRPETPAIVCVLPAYNEAENLQHIVPALCARLALLSPRFELIVVDDGSSDATAAVAVALSARYPVTLVRLSRNFGKEAAISAGIDHAEGDIVIVMDSDGQHPIDMLDVFFANHDPTQKNRQGPDEGSQYRSAVFVRDDDERRLVERKIEQLDGAGRFRKRIATTIEPHTQFWRAEEYHQRYLDKRGMGSCHT